MRPISLLLSGLLLAGGLAAAPVRIAETEGRIALASSRLEAEFATGKTGGLTQLQAAGGRNLAMPAEIWFGAMVWVAGKGEIRVYSPEAAEFRCTVRQEGEEAVVEAEGKGFGEKNGVDLAELLVRVSVRLGPDDEGLRWRCSAETPAGVFMQRFEAPYVQLAVPFGESGGDDAVVIGSPKGGVMPRPEEWKEGTSGGGVLAVQFGCAYDAAGGVMSMACDGEGYEKWHSVTRNSRGLRLWWRHAVTGTGTVAMPYDTVVRPFAAPTGEDTDWRHAADIYRDWAVGQAWCAAPYGEREDVAAWMKTGPTQVRFGRQWMSDPAMIERWFERYWDPHFAGLPLVVTFWGWEKRATWVSPDYFPPYPSAEGFAQMVDSVRRRGGHVFLWPSGYHWTVSYRKLEEDTFEWDDRARFEELGGMSRVSIDANGKPRIGTRSWLQGGSNASMCPGVPWTRQWFTDICRGCLDIGADMIQVDQVVRGAFPDCYSEHHGHMPGNGLWKTEVVAEQFREVLALGRARTPDFVLAVEEPQEWFNHMMGLMDYRDFQTADRNAQVPGHLPASVYGYVYHDFVPVFQSNPHGNDPVCQAYCLVTGQMPHLVPSERVGYDSLLLNGGFDDWGTEAPRFWDKVGGWQGKVWKGTCQRDTEVVAEGKSSLLLKNAAGDTVQVSQNIPTAGAGLIPGVPYRVSVKLRTAGVQSDNALNFGALAPGLRGLAGWKIPLPEDTAGEWREGSVVVTIPEGSVTLRIMLHLNGEGSVWLDDMRLEPVDPAAVDMKKVAHLPGDHALMVQWSRLFHGEGRPWLLLGRMLHPPRLESATVKYQKLELPAVFHNAFRSPDGEEAVILANATAEVQDVTLHGPLGGKLVLQPYEVRLLRR